MQLHVILYGGARVVIGKSVVDLSFDTSSVTMAQLVDQLIAAYPRVRPYLLETEGTLHTSLRVLLNNERPDPDVTLATLLHADDKITFLVAVAGGSGLLLTGH